MHLRALTALTNTGLIALGLVVLTFYVSVFSPNVDPASDFTNMGAARLLIGVAMLATLPWYRKEPRILIAAGMINTLVLLNDPYVLAVGLTVWMIRARERTDWIVAGAGGAAILINFIIHLRDLDNWSEPFDAEFNGVVVTFVAVGAIAIAGITTAVVRNKRDVHVANVAAAESKTILDEEMTRQQERENLAREVHDTLATRLSGIAMQAATLDGPKADSIRSNSSRALADLRGILTSIREGTGAPAVQAAASHNTQQDLVDVIEDAESLGLTVSPCRIVLDSYSDAPFDLQRCLFRITQEALSNALRHSDNETMALTIQGGPGTGIHFEASNTFSQDSQFTEGAHRGLIGVSERVAMLHGSVDKARDNGRFTLTINLPWQEGSAVESARE